MVAGRGGEDPLGPPAPYLPPSPPSDNDDAFPSKINDDDKPKPLEDMTSDEISAHCDSFSGPDIPCSVHDFNPPPPTKPPLQTRDLFPLTPSVFVPDREAAYSPQLLHFCLSKPIVLIRNLCTVTDLDLTIYTTRALVQAHPTHPMEIRTQMEQTANENWDPTMSKQVWGCVSSRSSSTIAQYARYQSANFQEAMATMNESEKTVNPVYDFSNKSTRRMIQFGTNCDLSEEKKWAPQLQELNKLPAWSRVVSSGNMLTHIGHQILGMNTVQLYMKVPCARTPGHQENNNFCAININIGPGDSEWFGVSNEYWYALQQLCEKNSTDYLHGCWWPRISDLMEAGIPTYRFLQKPGDMVWVNAGCVHWVQATGWCNNIAWNVGPLTHHQFELALERYEWNKSQKYQSIVAMVNLTWNLARNIRTRDMALHKAIRRALARSLVTIVRTLNLMGEMGVRRRFHGREKTEPTHYCVHCEEEVFNTLMVRNQERKYVVHCLQCALKSDVSLRAFICLEEFKLQDLFETYDKFCLSGLER